MDAIVAGMSPFVLRVLQYVTTLKPELRSRKSIMHYFKQMPTVLEDQ